jgi:hypothetical protein
MLAAAHLDNYLFLLFVAVAILFQLLTRAATKSGRKTGGEPKRRSTSLPQTPRSTTTEAEQSDEDRIRKFLEALGQPTTSKPPPPVAPRTDIPLRPVAPVSAPGAFPTRGLTPKEKWKSIVVLQGPQPVDLPRKITLPGQIPPTREAKPFRPTTADSPFEVHRGPAPLESAPVIKTPAEAYAIATQPVLKRPEGKTDLATMLRSSSGLRDAIILREIFGPPRSLQPLDLVGTV